MLSNVSYASTCWCSVIRKCLQASDWWFSCKLVMKKYKRPSLSRNAFHRKHKKNTYLTHACLLSFLYSPGKHTRVSMFFHCFPRDTHTRFPFFLETHLYQGCFAIIGLRTGNTYLTHSLLLLDLEYVWKNTCVFPMWGLTPHGYTNVFLPLCCF